MNVKNYDKTLGSYMPSFFYMDLDFEFYKASSTIYNLNERDFSIFVHEYIHFLQDISSYALMNNSYVYSEYIHAAVNYIRTLPIGEFDVPLKLPFNYGNVELNQFVNNACMGSNDTVDIVVCNRLDTKRVKVPYRNNIVKELFLPYIVSNHKRNLFFGTYAIMESMAYLMEKRMSKGFTPVPDYPYLSAQMVIEQRYPEFGKDDLNIIALCDISLQYSNPGWIFVRFLDMMKEISFLPSDPHDLYIIANQLPVSQMGKNTSFDNGIIEMAFMLTRRLKLYLSGSRYSGFHNMVNKYFGFGLRNRMQNKSFMLDLALDGYGKDNSDFIKIFLELGSPIIRDMNGSFFQVPFINNKSNEYMSIFPAIEQIFKCLSQGADICEMIDMCEYTIQYANDIFGDTYEDYIPDVNKKCYNNPWCKINEPKLCPYALLWKHWGLSNYIPRIKN